MSLRVPKGRSNLPMPKIDIDKILKAFPLLSPEETDPGLRVSLNLKPQPKDEYIPPEETAGGKRGFWTKRKELKEAQEILSKIERIPQAPEEAARRFFDVDLSQLIRFSRHHPKEVQKLLQRALEKSPNKNQVEFWYHLVQAAQGNTQPLFQTFEKADLKTRLAIFRVTLFSPQVGDGPLIGELLMKLMETTTHQEREQWVEPTLHSILNRGVWSTNIKVQNKLAWLSALYHGWRKEAEELG